MRNFTINEIVGSKNTTTKDGFCFEGSAVNFFDKKYPNFKRISENNEDVIEYVATISGKKCSVMVIAE